MKQEALDKLKALKRFSGAVGGFWADYDKVTAEPRCDKYQAQFDGDSRFTVFKTKNPLRFDALIGYYGNSGCRTFQCGISDDLAAEYLPKALNNLKREIFAEMAKLANQDAAKLIGKAEAELNALQTALTDAKSAA